MSKISEELLITDSFQSYLPNVLCAKRNVINLRSLFELICIRCGTSNVVQYMLGIFVCMKSHTHLYIYIYITMCPPDQCALPTPELEHVQDVRIHIYVIWCICSRCKYVI